MKMNFARVLAAALLASAAGPMVAALAIAQVGGIVHDPRNYSQNILTAARTLEQINNQIKQLQNQATSLLNEARNLQSLPTSTLGELQAQIDQTKQLLSEAEGIAYDVADMRPGMIAATGLDAAEPLLDATADLVGPVGLFTNFVQILILLIAWVIVVLAFFILAVQVFVTILEFKLVTLAGFVLLPFAFFNRTAFMAERVLGHVISSGIKLLVLAVITGIGVTLFERFMEAGLGTEPDIREVMAIALGALTLLGLGIFGPSVANGIVAGGPQLGAGAAAGTTLAAGATIAAGAAGATLATGAAASMAGKGAAGASRAAGSASASYARGAAGKSGMRAFGSGMANVARDAASSAGSPLRQAAAKLRHNFAEGQAGKAAPTAAGAEPSGQPAWAAAMKRRQAISSGATIGAQTLKQGDSHGAGSSPDISQKD